LQFIKGIMVVS